MPDLVMHVDMDAFFASVEQLDNEIYRGHPVIVGGVGRRSVVSTASYEARRYGVHSAMPAARAHELCPQGIFVQGRMSRYKEVSESIFRLLRGYSPLVEPLSIDEAFLDLSGMERFFSEPAEYGQRLRNAIKQEIGLTASVGIAPNKFLAKFASDMEKPDGLVVLQAEDIEERVWPEPVERLWGAGKKTSSKLRLMGCRTIGDVAGMPPEKLQQSFGMKPGSKLYELAHGRDDRQVEGGRQMKSLSKEMTFSFDLLDEGKIRQNLLFLAEQVGWRLRQRGLSAQSVQLKVRYGDFSTYTRSAAQGDGFCYDEDIFRVARGLFADLGIRNGVRLLGIAASGLSASGQMNLFADRKKAELYGAIDGLKGRFGEGIIGHLGVKPPVR